MAEKHAFKKRKVEEESKEKKVVKVKIEAKREDQQDNNKIIVPPSDSWSWRKYGQKAISGSPYLRSYYKCNSIEGCPAKKQVERSKEDSSTLIITYTFTHNHPSPSIQPPTSAQNQNFPSKKAQAQALHTTHYRPNLPKLKQSSNKDNDAEVGLDLKDQGHKGHFLYVNSPTYASLGENEIQTKGKQDEEEPYFVSLDTFTPGGSQNSFVVVGDEQSLGDIPHLKSLSTSEMTQDICDYFDDLDELDHHSN